MTSPLCIFVYPAKESLLQLSRILDNTDKYRQEVGCILAVKDLMVECQAESSNISRNDLPIFHPRMRQIVPRKILLLNTFAIRATS